jgi:hypothetical protein
MTEQAKWTALYIKEELMLYHLSIACFIIWCQTSSEYQACPAMYWRLFFGKPIYWKYFKKDRKNEQYNCNTN